MFEFPQVNIIGADVNRSVLVLIVKSFNRKGEITDYKTIIKA